MAGWTDNVTFEPSTYSTGNLTGQDGWALGAGTVTVSNTYAANGTQSVTASASGSNWRKRAFTAANDDGTIFYVSCRASSMSLTGSITFYMWANGDGSQRIMDFEISTITAGTWYLRNEAGTRFSQGSGLSADTWYRFGFEFDFTNNRMRANIDGGAFGSWVSFTNARSQINYMWVQAGAVNASVTWYWDEISDQASFGSTYRHVPQISPFAGL